MGTDKALLAAGGRTLLEQQASTVRAAVGNVTIVADPARYTRFGLPVIPDQRPGCGPLGGIVAALASADQPWSVIVACDMPGVSPGLLRALLREAVAIPGGCQCLVPLGPDGAEPLCAVYHRTALPVMSAALDRKLLTMRAVLELLDTRYTTPAGAEYFLNINTPEDWAAHE